MKHLSGVHRRYIRTTLSLIPVLFLFVSGLVGQPSFASEKKKPFGDRKRPASTKERVHLQHAEVLEFDQKRGDYQILKGDVRFKHDSMYMFCDSAYFYEKTNAFDAFGNVRMEQGDTLFVYGDMLFYDGNTEIARLREHVKLINRDVTLSTDSLNYDQVLNTGYYFEGGEIRDKENVLTSQYGEYNSQTKLSVFHYDVKLDNPRFILTSDTLHYNTQTKIATILGPSIMTSDENVIYSSFGWYNTATDLSELFDYSRLTNKTGWLTGDTIYYNRNTGVGEVFGNMLLNDTTKKIIIEGQYGFYNEIEECSLATDSARVIEYSSVDTLFMHADTLRSFKVDSSNYQISAYYGVRFFQNDGQGVADSLVYHTKDSVMILYGSPVLWSGNSQIFGDTIKVFMNDSTIDRAHFPTFAFVAQQKGANYYNQMSGKEMWVYFQKGELYRAKVDGNVRTIFFPEESDSTLIGMNAAESSFMDMTFEQRKIKRLVMWPDVVGVLTPMEQIKPDQLNLPSFIWYEDIRPLDKWDIFRKERKKRERTLNNPF